MGFKFTDVVVQIQPMVGDKQYCSLENFVWNYFVVENVRENNFRGLLIPTKIF